ncbi:hypothetical protein CEXT_1621 [Caerostris extrusa]|uniref:Uncharacterized protein n=1 Tax=Caerostris extrusa TaxID=172846 RepID=A0AAV4XGE3_CAEEX|nr:hypothetical protein CEXT_1621 [Caerostris extrusa]
MGQLRSAVPPGNQLVRRRVQAEVAGWRKISSAFETFTFLMILLRENSLQLNFLVVDKGEWKWNPLCLGPGHSVCQMEQEISTKQSTLALMPEDHQKC